MENNQYIPLGTNHLADDNLISLIECYGMAGYGIYIALLFELRQRADYVCALRSLPALARRWDVDPDTLESIVHDFGLFGFVLKTDADPASAARMEPDHFYSHYLNVAMEPLEQKRLLLSAAGRRRAITAERAVDGRFTSLVQQVEKSKEEESKSKEEQKESKTPPPENKTDPNESSTEPQSENPAAPMARKWELLLDAIFGEQSWVEIQAMHSGMRLAFLEQLPQILAFFKSHIRTYGKEGTIGCESDAKSYFSNFIRPASATRKALDAYLDKLQRTERTNDPYRHEDHDPPTGARSYCGRPIPPNAPPRPHENAVWSEELQEWA